MTPDFKPWCGPDVLQCPLAYCAGIVVLIVRILLFEEIR